MPTLKTSLFVPILALFALGGSARAEPPEAPSTTAIHAETEARAHFKRAEAHFDKQEWREALAEYRQSLSFKSTRGAMASAAACLRALGQYDDALDQYEELRREFPVLSPKMEARVAPIIAELRGLVGTLVVVGDAPTGGTLFVDDRSRGTLPLASPLRMAVGTHSIRVEKEGFEPIVAANVEVKPGQENAAQLTARSRKGRLAVREAHGWVLDVEVDGKVVGTTPWEGLVEIAEHQVRLQGFVGLDALAACGVLEQAPGETPRAATEGARMASAVRKENVGLYELKTVTLGAEEQDASLQIDSTPHGARVSIDDKVVGKTPWNGRLDLREHAIDVTADDYVPVRQQVVLERRKQREMQLMLEHLTAKGAGKVSFEATGGVPLSVSLGGLCSKVCPGPAFGGLATFKGEYQLGHGLGVGGNLGYLAMMQAVTGRSTTLQPVGLSPDPAIVNDHVGVRGFLVGVWSGFTRGTRFPFRARLGAGGLFGLVSDLRTGKLTPRGATSPTSFAAVEVAPSASWVYLNPELRLGVRLGSHVEISAGVEALVLFAVRASVWDNQKPVQAGGDGLGTFNADAITGPGLFAVTPGLGLRYEL